MRLFATRHLEEHLTADGPYTPGSVDASEVSVALPTATIEAVEKLVGSAHVAAFVTAAAQREVHKRALDALAPPLHE